jgi:hypothetical protein
MRRRRNELTAAPRLLPRRNDIDNGKRAGGGRRLDHASNRRAGFDRPFRRLHPICARATTYREAASEARGEKRTWQVVLEAS